MTIDKEREEVTEAMVKFLEERQHAKMVRLVEILERDIVY